MRATYKLGRDVISKIFRGGGGNARYWNEPRSRYEAGSAPEGIKGVRNIHDDILVFVALIPDEGPLLETSNLIVSFR